MEIRSILNKPCTRVQKEKFIVEYNHKQGLPIVETDTEFQALCYTVTELEKQEQEQIAMLKLTRGDVFRGLLQAKGITRNQIRALIEAMPETTDYERIVKELALIDFDEALDFYRGNTLIDTLGEQLGISKTQLDEFFRTNDYNSLLLSEEEVPF